MNSTQDYPPPNPLENESLLTVANLQQERSHRIKRGFFEAGMVAVGSVATYSNIKNGNNFDTFLSSSITLIYGRLLINNFISVSYLNKSIKEYTP